MSRWKFVFTGRIKPSWPSIEFVQPFDLIMKLFLKWFSQGQKLCAPRCPGWLRYRSNDVRNFATRNPLHRLTRTDTVTFCGIFRWNDFLNFPSIRFIYSLRDRKRYAAMSCPLVHIEWWRVCLDEAQMVENVNWSFSKMAQMLPAVNRWCVSGTPIPKSLQGKMVEYNQQLHWLTFSESVDLYGLVCFLDIDPITDIDLWHSLIMEPFKLNNSQIAITTNLFGKIFWRTEQEYVQDQVYETMTRDSRLEYSFVTFLIVETAQTDGGYPSVGIFANWKIFLRSASSVLEWQI